MEKKYMENGSPALGGRVTDPLDLVKVPPTQTPLSYATDASTLDLNISVEEQSGMMRSIQEIFELEESEEADEEMEDEGDVVVDVEDQERRTAKLKGVLPTLARLWWADSEHIAMAAEKLADGSRDPKWRVPLGESGVLNFFLEILSAHTLRHTLKIHVLRLIGNSCADTDSNRARVVSGNYLPPIILQLRDSSLLPFAIPVLYNICLDYEPAQLQASNSFLSKALIELISDPRFVESRAFLGYSCKILELLISQPSEPELAPENTAVILVQFAADKHYQTDMDDFISLVKAAVLYLQHVKFQQAIIAQGALETTLAVLVESYTRFDTHTSLDPASPDEDDAKTLTDLRTQLNQVLSDISALPEFKNTVPVVSPLCNTLRRWLSSSQLQLQICACIMLGNLARSDDVCEEFVQVTKVHIPLIAILSTSDNSQLLFSALGFLKNLALPLNNKIPLGEAGIFDVLPRLWLLDSLQQIQFSSISLTRQLLISTYDNIRKMVKRLSDDEDSPANQRTNISLLIALFQRTDIEPIKMEIARLITAVCRTHNTLSLEKESDPTFRLVRTNFLLRHPDIGLPLGFMVSQTKWPVVRSEGWFVFALMARIPEGAQCISDMMQDVAVFEPLVELLTGKNLVEFMPSTSSNYSAPPTSTSSTTNNLSLIEGQSPESAKGAPQSDQMVRIDRENALVLVSELLKARGSEMAQMRRTLFEDLLKSGSELMLSHREGRAPAESRPLPLVASGEGGGAYEVSDVAEQSVFELS